MCISTYPVFRELLQDGLSGLIELTPEQLSALDAHYELLVRWNGVLNLTSIESVREVVQRHYCESVFLAAHLPPGPLRIADIGSGAGFPGFPVAVLRRDCSVTVIEGHRRKAVFLREASRGRPNMRVLPVRAQDVRERFDRAMSRGVSYRDLAPVLKNLAAAADLLIGEEQPPDDLGFCWGQGIRLPWGRNRFFVSGVSRETCETYVSRET